MNVHSLSTPARKPLSLLIYFRGDMTNRSIGPPSLILHSTCCSHAPRGPSCRFTVWPATDRWLR